MNIYRRLRADPSDWFSAEEVAKAKDYQRPLTVLRVASSVVGLALMLVVISTHAAPRFGDAVGATGWVPRLFVVLAAVLVAYQVVDLPFELWREFRHERAWGFSTQTPARFVGDTVKDLLVSVVLLGVLLLPLWALIRSTELWWLAGWFVFLLFSVVLAFLGPILLLPLFNKLVPLEDADLSGDLRELGSSAGVNISEVQVMDASKRTRKDNAFFAGLGRTRRVVLFDNILTQPRASIRAVVAHELGHWRRRHVPQRLAAGTVLSLGLFYLLKVVSGWDAALDWAGVSSIADPASLPLFFLVLVVGQQLLTYLLAWQSRALEREADIESITLTRDIDGFQQMARTLVTKNLSELAPSRLTYLRLDHPPPAERLELVEEWRTEFESSVAERR